MAMYKYNSWTLPGLPTEWSQTTHPYAVMLRARESGVIEAFQLLVSSLPFVVKNVNGVQVIAFPCEASVYNSFWFTDNEQWWDLAEVELEHAENCLYHYVAASTNDEGLSYDWAWCNESIRDDANNVVYPGSVPILIEEPEPEPEPEAYDKKNFLTGLAAALCSKARAFPQRGSIGYRYGSVVAPKLPEWDKEKYPHTVIHSYNTDETYLYAYDQELNIVEYDPDYEVEFGTVIIRDYPKIKQPKGVYCYAWELVDFCWRPFKYNYTPYSSDKRGYPVWANYTLYNEDGVSVYLKKTEPTSVNVGKKVEYPEAYWCNELEVPPFPKVDRTEYPFMYLGSDLSSYDDPYRLHLYYSKKPMAIFDDSLEGATWVGNEGDTALEYISYCSVSSTYPEHLAREWVLNKEIKVSESKYEAGYWYAFVESPYWTEYEIRTPEGELYLAKSPDPILSNGSILF